MPSHEPIFGMPISHVRAILGFACREILRTGRPLGLWRYNAMDLVIVPIAEWKRLKALEAGTMATNDKDPGELPRSEGGGEGDVGD